MEDTPLKNFSVADILPDAGWDFAGAVVMARKGSDQLVSHRLQEGSVFDPNNDMHVLGWFVANAAGSLIPMARDFYRRVQKQQAANSHQFLLKR